MSVSEKPRRKVPPHQAPRCASCRSRYIYERLGDGLWKCRTCGELFKVPVTEATITRAAGSGIIAPRSYRSQIAFEGMKNK